MVKNPALPEIWNSRWTVRSVALELLTFLSAPVAIGCAIACAILARIGEWPIVPSALIEFLCLIYAFCALGLPILPRDQKMDWRTSIAQSIWVVIPGLASVLVWVIHGINNTDLLVQLAVIIASTSIAINVQRRSLLISSSVVPPLWMRRIDGVRLGVLVAFMAGAAMFYVLLPTFVFV
jgi:hypothetical protein